METPQPLLMEVPFLCEFCLKVNIYNSIRRNICDTFDAANSGCFLCNIVHKSLSTLHPRGSRFDSMGISVSASKREVIWQFNRERFSLGIYTTEDDRLAKFLPSRPLSLDVSSKESFSIMSTWLQQCLSNHKKCQDRGKVNQKLPTRVIDVQLEGGDPFLVETNQRPGSWVALSYCWGFSPTAVTTSQNLQQHYNRIPMSNFPQTMKDAIVITRRMGYRYLWIDSLCIIQDSPKDWAVESLKMADVYGGASLTIAAEASVDTASGIFDSSNAFHKRHSEKYNFSIEGYHPSTSREYGRVYLRDIVDSNPFERAGCLRRRAWALQEDLMSRRLISFGEEQLYWRCVTQQSEEASPTQALNPQYWYFTGNN